MRKLAAPNIDFFNGFKCGGKIMLPTCEIATGFDACISFKYFGNFRTYLRISNFVKFRKSGSDDTTVKTRRRGTEPRNGANFRVHRAPAAGAGRIYIHNEALSSASSTSAHILFTPGPRQSYQPEFLGPPPPEPPVTRASRCPDP